MKALVLFSGGVDSTTCLGMAVAEYGAEGRHNIAHDLCEKRSHLVCPPLLNLSGRGTGS